MGAVGGVIIVEERSFWSMVQRLWEFEGWRCLWRLPVATLAYALPGLVFVGVTVLARYMAGDDFDAATALLSATVGATATALVAPRLARQRLHRRVIGNRLATFEQPNPAASVNILIRDEDLGKVECALRRARLNPARHARVAGPPESAPELTTQVWIEEPEKWATAKDDADRIRRVTEIMHAGGFRARVGGAEVGPGRSANPATR